MSLSQSDLETMLSNVRKELDAKVALKKIAIAECDKAVTECDRVHEEWNVVYAQLQRIKRTPHGAA